MRLLHVAAVAAFALVSCCDAAAAESKSTKLTSANDAALASEHRLLRKRNDGLDLNDGEDRTIAGLGDLDLGERGTFANSNYKALYKTKTSPKQLAKEIALSFGSMEQRKELQRFYLGYYSYYTAKKRRERRKKELAGYIYP
ncbi:putative secreted RxLR effector protein [Phytophthora cinnamomi]|uniref:putative secreted RxLR effector protein n=1 Tax=Phytophthora cinnamomi TaxID=4785 RepID=UPI00355A4E7D|nr:putative secreted RxLR effector protein [Phytophthora cinnamomi]